MIKGDCFIENCLEKPIAKCNCKEPATLFCFMHMPDHFRLPSGKGHRYEDLYFHPSKETRGVAIQKMQDIKNQIEDAKAKLVAESNQILRTLEKVLEKALSKLQELEKQCDDIVFAALQEEILDVPTENEIEKILKLDAEDAWGVIEGWNLQLLDLDIELIKYLIAKTYANLDCSIFKPNPKPPMELNQLMFFKDETKELVTINLETLELSSILLDNLPGRYIEAYDGYALLPDGSVFCNAWNGSGTSNSTFILTQNKEIRLLTSGVGNVGHTCAYGEGYIYVFGGNIRQADRYSLKDDKWESLAPLLEDFWLAISLFYASQVIISGHYARKAIIYDTRSNSYRDVPNLILEQYRYKIMLSANKRAYIIECPGRIFESKVGNLLEWNNIGSNQIHQYYQISPIVSFRGNMHFVEDPTRLIEFKLKEKCLQEVKDYNNFNKQV